MYREDGDDDEKLNEREAMIRRMKTEAGGRWTAESPRGVSDVPWFWLRGSGDGYLDCVLSGGASWPFATPLSQATLR